MQLICSAFEVLAQANSKRVPSSVLTNKTRDFVQRVIRRKHGATTGNRLRER
jgi:hypothetical protein